MTAAEFKVLREALGLSAKWLEHRTRYRAVKIREWEKGKKAVPNSVAQYLYKLEAKFHTLLEADFSNYKNTFEFEKKTDKVVLLHFRKDVDLWSFHPELTDFSVTTYALLLARIKQKLMEQGIKTSIKYMETEAYFGWLGNQPDTVQQRTEWALMRPQPSMSSLKPQPVVLQDPT